MEKTYSWKWWTIYITLFIFGIIGLISIPSLNGNPTFGDDFYRFLSFIIPLEILISFASFAFMASIPVGMVWLFMTFKRARNDLFFRKFVIAGSIIFILSWIGLAFFSLTQQRLPNIPQIQTR